MAIALKLVSCASVSNPEGGAKDVTPPTLINSNPKHQALNISTKTISLEFDEEIQPNSLNKELLITPNIEGKYAITTKRNRIDLVFEQPLEDSTTYTFNFRNGIVDITEKNKAEGLLLIFSTGSYIDSSRVSGTVVELLKQLPEKEAVVALYPISDSLNIRKNRPYYQAVTDEEGVFSFENVREGTYRIFALMDKNNNSIYDNENERIGYLDKPITVTPANQEILLQTVRIDTRKPILSRRDRQSDRFVANYNEGIRSFNGRAIEGTKDSLIYKIQADGKAVEIFGGNGFTGGRTILTAVDSSGNVATDTLAIAFEGKRSQRIRGAVLKTQGGRNGYRIGQPITIELETPVNITSNEPLQLWADSVILKRFKYPEEITLDKTTTELTFTLPNINGNRAREYSLLIDSTAVIPVQGENLKLPRLTLNIAEAKGTGSVKGTVTSNYTSYFLQILNEKYEIVQTQPANKLNRFEFKNLEPGMYVIRILIDENNDGIWNGPDPDLVRLPEKVFIYPNQLDVRANWEMNDIKIEFKDLP